MFSKRKKYKDLDFINSPTKVNIVPKLKQNPKITSNDLDPKRKIQKQ